MKKLERVFESVLWNSRLVVIEAVVTSSMNFNNPMQLLYLAGGIALIGLALYLSHAGEVGHGKTT